LKIFIETYGCTYNKADSDSIRKVLSAKLPKAVFCASEAQAQVAIINSCSVKDATSSKILHKLSQLHSAGKKVVVCGCLAQTSPELVRKAHPKAVVLGTYSLSRIADAVVAASKGKPAEFLEKREGKTPLNPVIEGVVARIPIAQGCTGACSYCSAKIARGALQSRPPKEILLACEKALKNGAKELQFTAQDTGCYGFDLQPNTDIAQLLERVCEIPGAFRIRVGMMNPQHAKKIISPLLRAFGHEKVYKFLHVPVQSGSAKVLKGMRRQHSAKDFEDVVCAFREKFPEMTIATDIIVGFPTETGEDFLQTVDLVKRVRPTVCNVSKYSPRPGTDAAKLAQLDNLVVKRRSEELSALCKTISAENKSLFVGKRLRVLVAEKTKSGMVGRADNYLSVVLPAGKKQAFGDFLEVKILESGQSHLKA
jgi:MiaB-like tRNA modifying enzyme